MLVYLTLLEQEKNNSKNIYNKHKSPGIFRGFLYL